MSANDKVLAAAAEGLKRNPLPIVLIGMGAVWLAAEQARSRPAPKPAGYFDIYEGFDPDEGSRERLAARLGVARAKLSGAVDAARGRASALARSIRASSYHRSIRKRLGAAVEVETAAAVGVGIVIGLALGIGLSADRKAR
ncbi:hypothetical protein [uncultured Phenylobacterium sp.]|uniref:hypothetical protein n=1 Tax=uncultured Phenylobacterium sp. TaxID=349273 RepID=UPI0025F63442|nr:hypothetical protein [uncultured Phenylobacterium sp.]